MKQTIVDGFKFVQWSGGKELMIVESRRLRECIDYCNARQVGRIIIGPVDDYSLDDINFLEECSSVVDVHLQRSLLNYSGLYELTGLTSLSALFRHSIDISRLPRLVNLSTDWNDEIDDALRAKRSLESLWLRGYKPKTKDLAGLNALTDLEELTLVLSSITSLKGIEHMQRMRKLDIAHCYRLCDIRHITRLSCALEEFQIDHCKAIEDLTIVRSLKLLRKYIMFGAGSIPTLRFVGEMPNLKFLSFVDTRVLDGDMTPCFKLDYAGFLKNKHYSHTPQEVLEHIKACNKSH